MAGRIPEDFINQVRSAVDIVDVISQYVSLEKKGKDYIGLCPFHQEKTPSFTVNEGKQFFKCFGCGKGGNVFKFLMYQENLTFPESVKKVADMANIPMPKGVDTQSAPLSPLMKIYQDATEFYQHILITTKVGERGLQYAKNRELDEDILRHFKIGYAPDNDSILLTFLKQKGYAKDVLKKSGLFVESQDGRLFDRFRDRLMFPLADEAGRTIAFSGRRISDDPEIAKYVNSPETEIFTKSKLLYHLSEAKRAARSENHLILYEGYMDVIAAYKAGVKSGVASMGTSLTNEQVYILRRINSNVIINYDGDAPGLHATERAIDLFNKVTGFNLGIIKLPENLDPDEYIKKYGKEKYQEKVKEAISSIDFLFDRLSSKYNIKNDREKLAYINDAVGIVAKLSDPVATDMYLKSLAKKTDVTTESLRAALIRERRKSRRVQQYQKQNTAYDSYPSESLPVEEVINNTPHSLENKILKRLLYLFIHYEEAEYYLIKRYQFPNKYTQNKNYLQLVNEWLKYEYDHEDIVKEWHENQNHTFKTLKDILNDIEMSKAPSDFSDSTIFQIDRTNNLKQEIDDQIKALNKIKIDEQVKQLRLDIDEAEKNNDSAELLRLTNKILELQRQKG